MNFDKVQLDANQRPLPMCRCEVCGYEFDCASHSDEGKRPRPGDFSLCLKCGELYVFNPDMTVRVPTLAELKEMTGELETQVKHMQTMIRKERPLDKKGQQ